MKKNKDPYPITDVYHVTDTLVDGATVVVTDLCDNLSNNIDTDTENILSDTKKINSKKFNSISVSNGADGAYPVWLGVDKNNKVRKIFAETSGGSFAWGEKHKTLVSWSWNKEDMNDQFFTKGKIDKKVKREKLFDMKVTSGAIAVADHGGNFRFEHHEILNESLDDKYFKKENIFQNNYPIGLFKFKYGAEAKSESSSFATSSMHDDKVVHLNEYRNRTYVEFLSNLLDDTCYPTKYIFEEYLEETLGYRDIVELKVNDKKISANYLSDRLPKALKILRKQTKILFKDNFKEVYEIRKNQFENLIFTIIRDIEPQELDLPSFGKKKTKKNKKKVENKLTVETGGLPYIQETFYNGFKLKEEPTLEHSVTIPIKNGNYPCYVHSYPDKSDDEYDFNYVKIVVEGIEGCYLSRDQKGKLVFNKRQKESSFIKEHIKNKSKTISLDQIVLRNSENLDELSRIDFVEELELHGLKNIKNWNGLSKLKNLRTLKLVSCEIQSDQSENFFKNLYSLKNLIKFSIDDSCSLSLPKKKLSNNLYFKKLKLFEIDFRKDWKKNTSETKPDHQGYGNENLYFLNFYLLNISNFPNFEKFKSLERINLYNIFDEDEPNGNLFGYRYGLSTFEKIGKLIKNSKNLKEVWLHGFKFQGDISLYSNSVSRCLNALNTKKNILINGKKIQENKINFKDVNSIELISKIEEYHNSKIISFEKDKLTLSYFSILSDENKDFQKKIFKQKPEEIIINPTYQFVRSEMMYGDTFKPFNKHVSQNKNLKRLFFKFDNKIVDDDWGDLAGSWSEWECRSFCQYINDLLILNKNLKIFIDIPNLNEELKDLENISKYILLFEYSIILSEKKETRNRLIFKQLLNKEVKQIIDKYLLEVVDTLVVIEDNYGWNDSTSVRNIEFLDRFQFEDASPFKININTKSINLSYDGEKPYEKESRFLQEMFEDDFWTYSDAKFYHFLNDKIEGNSYDKPIILVKQKYLDQLKTTIFKNIKHYFYFAKADYRFDDYDNVLYKKFWKEKEIFTLPQSIKFKNLETLNIIGGRDVNLKKLSQEIDFTKIKQIILESCVGSVRDFPYCPNLKTLIITDRYCAKAKNYSNFKNLPSLEHLEFKSLFNYNDDRSEWCTTEFDFTDIYKLSKLKFLKLNQLNPEYLPPLKTLKNLEDLNLSFKLITGDMGSDDGIINENIRDKDFEFLKNLNNLKSISIELPLDHSSVKGEQLISYINSNIEVLDLEAQYDDAEIQLAYQTINKIIKRFKNLKKIKLELSRNNNFESNDKEKIIYFRKTGERWKEGNSPRPFILDFNNFCKLKYLTDITFSQLYRDEMGFKIKNPRSITKMKNIKKINIKKEKFKTEDLQYIRSITLNPRDNFLKECQKKDKSIKSEYDLNEKDKKKYDKLNREIKFDGSDWNWSGDTIDEILKERKKKKSETAN